MDTQHAIDLFDLFTAAARAARQGIKLHVDLCNLGMRSPLSFLLPTPLSAPPRSPALPPQDADGASGEEEDPLAQRLRSIEAILINSLTTAMDKERTPPAATAAGVKLNVEKTKP